MKICVVIPCYNVKKHILKVISQIPLEVHTIYVVDDRCPEKTGSYLKDHNQDPRVKIVFHERNLGVGGAVKSGFKEALKDQMDIVIKLDGDEQMDPAEIPKLIKPLVDERADYTKANRFFSPQGLKDMPLIRKLGNSALCFLSKISSGYWNVMDPTNGFFALHVKVLKLLELEKISNRYFFESDLLFRLGLVKAVIKDVPIAAIYGDETSNLKINKLLTHFLKKHLECFYKRIIYQYFVHDFNIGSLQIMGGLSLFFFGLIYGLWIWIEGNHIGVANQTGKIMISVVPFILGFQTVLSAITYDILKVPKETIHQDL